MKFTIEVKELNRVLGVAAIVPPKQITQQGGSGYLFSVRGGHCYVYSQDKLHMVRADCEITDVEGEGEFVYPSVHVPEFVQLEGKIEFEYDAGDPKHVVRYRSDTGDACERSSYEPDMIEKCDDSLAGAKTSYSVPSGVLREALGMANVYSAKATDTRVDDMYKTIQVFDGSKPEWVKGNGVLFSADSTRAFYFDCDKFRDKGFAVHGQHLQFVSNFLPKCEGDVLVRVGERMTFIEALGGVNKGAVLGWTHQVKTHPKYAYWPLENDGFVLTLDRDKVLRKLRYLRATLVSTKNKIRVVYDNKTSSANGELRFEMAESLSKAHSAGLPIISREIKEDRGFSVGANIDHLIDLVEPVKCNEVAMRFCILTQGSKEVMLFRTVDAFGLDAEGKVTTDLTKEGVSKCRVTRFMPSKE